MPAAQSRQDAAPVAALAYVPAMHCTQVLASDALSKALAVPASQTTQLVAPAPTL